MTERSVCEKQVFHFGELLRANKERQSFYPTEKFYLFLCIYLYTYVQDEEFEQKVVPEQRKRQKNGDYRLHFNKSVTFNIARLILFFHIELQTTR